MPSCIPCVYNIMYMCILIDLTAFSVLICDDILILTEILAGIVSISQIPIMQTPPQALAVAVGLVGAMVVVVGLVVVVVVVVVVWLVVAMVVVVGGGLQDYVK